MTLQSLLRRLYENGATRPTITVIPVGHDCCRLTVSNAILCEEPQYFILRDRGQDCVVTEERNRPEPPCSDWGLLKKRLELLEKAIAEIKSELVKAGSG